MPRLLVVHHTPSPTLRSMLELVLDGTRADGLEDLEVTVEPALTAGPTHVLSADAIILGTPANIGYMSGAMKHFFDQVYYPCLDATAGRPFGVYIHGNDDTTGARRAVAAITTGLGWREVVTPVEVVGAPRPEGRDALWNLGATVAAAAMDVG